jgi:hypothetical protein
LIAIGPNCIAGSAFRCDAVKEEDILPSSPADVRVGVPWEVRMGEGAFDMSSVSQLDWYVRSWASKHLYILN